jgi:hypothetical protein
MTGPREAMLIHENRTAVHFFCVTVLTGVDGGSYNAFIDGGAANEQRLMSCLRFSVTTAARLDCRDDDASLRGPDVLVGTFGFRCHGLRCLTIESEERETWTADVLADKPFL